MKRRHYQIAELIVVDVFFICMVLIVYEETLLNFLGDTLCSNDSSCVFD